jgi:hypothetical protein
MSSGPDVIVIGCSAPHCADALAKGGLRVALVEHELVGDEPRKDRLAALVEDAAAILGAALFVGPVP